MKKFIFLPILFLCFSVSAKRILFSMTVDNPTVSTFKMEYQKASGAKPFYFKLNLASEPTTYFELDIPFAQLIKLTYGEESVRIYVGMDGEPAMRFVGGKLLESMQYSGAFAQANEVILEYERMAEMANIERQELGFVYWERSEDDIWSARELSVEQYFGKIATYEEGLINVLMQDRDILPAQVLEGLTTEANYLAANRRLTYFTANRSRLSKEEISAMSKTHNIFENVHWNRPDLVANAFYTNYLHGYMHYLYLPERPVSGKYEADVLYDIVTTEADFFAQNYLQHKLIIRYLERTNKATFGNEKLRDFKAQNAYPQLLQNIEVAYGGELALDENAPAPQIAILTEAGNFRQLTDYRGKVVFISFWASWCKPCLANFTKSEQLRKDLDAMGVVLLNISIDKTERKFRDALEKHNILGINALASDYEKCVGDYDLSTIPAYYIIDKNGNFAFLSEGEGRDVRSEFRVLVNQ